MRYINHNYMRKRRREAEHKQSLKHTHNRTGHEATKNESIQTTPKPSISNLNSSLRVYLIATKTAVQQLIGEDRKTLEQQVIELGRRINDAFNGIDMNAYRLDTKKRQEIDVLIAEIDAINDLTLERINDQERKKYFEDMLKRTKERVTSIMNSLQIQV